MISVLLVASIIVNVVLAIYAGILHGKLRDSKFAYDHLNENYGERVRQYYSLRNKVIAVLGDETK